MVSFTVTLQSKYYFSSAINSDVTNIYTFSYLGFKNIALYLTMKMGSPQTVINQDINVDKEARNCYHMMCYKGNYDCVVAMLNIERIFLKKILFDQLLATKNRYRFKNMDIKHGHLATSVFHDAETVKRHEEFNIRVFNLLQTYA